MLDLPAALIIGTIAGLMGALFIHVSISLGMVRRRFVDTSIKRVIEGCLFAFVTSTAFFMVVSLR